LNTNGSPRVRNPQGRTSTGRTARGREGEAVAARSLEEEGWAILARNFRGPRGEIDIIAARADTLAFVEVKNWSIFGAEDLEAALSSRKRRRIIETSKIFLSRNREYSSARVRYDVLLLREGLVARRIESAFTGDV
jgi:putative endonuclease